MDLAWMIVGVAAAVFALLWVVRRDSAGKASKRCSRCWRAVGRLHPYMDGRTEYWICDMCAAEMEFLNAREVPLPRK